MSRRMAGSHFAAPTARACLAPTSISTIIITTMTTTGRLGAIGA